MSLCPGCARRPQLHDEGLCAECREQKLLGDAQGEQLDVKQRFGEIVEEVGDIFVMTQDEAVEALQRLFLEIFDSLKEPARKPTLDAWAAGKAAIVISVHGTTIERLP